MIHSRQAKLSLVAATGLRVVVGVVFMLHGWEKYSAGISKTTSWLESIGIPYATLAAPVLMGVELLGGALLVLGLATRFAALVLLAEMVVAFLTVHQDSGFAAAEGGYELVLVLAVALAGFALAGSGATGLDRLLARRRG